MLVAASKNNVFQDILNKGDMNVCDGFGVQMMSGGKFKRFPGIDLMLALCEIAQDKGKSIYLLGGASNIAKQATDSLKERFPRLNIYFVQAGDNVIIEQSDHETMYRITSKNAQSLIQDIQAKRPDILFVAFGHGKQEWWIDTFKKDLLGTKIVMGVGGSFDFLSGHIVRAPKVFRRLGLEWLWRLIKQPQRGKRIFTAIIIFPFLVIKSYVVK